MSRTPISWNQLRFVTWEILDTPEPDGRYVQASTLANVSIFGLIVLNVLATILGTVGTIKEQYETTFRIFEVFSVTVFTVEYILRVWSCVEDQQHEHSAEGRFEFAKTLPAVIDLVAILPFYLSLGLDLRFVRVLRLLRVFRLAKAARYFPALRLFGKVLRDKKEEIVVSLAFLAILLVMTSSLIYYVERGAQPQVFGSIPEALWWSVVTVTTVGYGDAYPVTALGKVLGGMIALLGTGIGAIPAGLLASGFSEALEDDKEEEKQEEIHYCPHCGSELTRSVATHDGKQESGISQ